VWVVFSIVIQVLLDSARLSPFVMWTARISAPWAAVAVSGGFFALAFHRGFRWLVYLGGLGIGASTVLTGIGLLAGRPKRAPSGWAGPDESTK
jgi:hypothetical protein